MSTGLVQWTGQVLLTGFSAIIGAAALLFLQTIWRRSRYLRAFQTELEQNLTRVERISRRLKNIEDDEWRGSFTPLHTEVHQQIRIDDPTLFLRLNTELLELEEIYQGFRHLDTLSQPGTGVGRRVSKEEVIEDLDFLIENLKEAVDTVEAIREDNWIYRRIADGQSLYYETIELGNHRAEDS